MQQMKIVVLDGYTENPGDLTWNGISAMGDLTVYDRTPVDDKEEIIRRIGDAQVFIQIKCRWTELFLMPVPPSLLCACWLRDIMWWM